LINSELNGFSYTIHDRP